MVANTSIMAHRDAELEGGGDHLIGLLTGCYAPGLDEMRAYRPYRDIGMRCPRGSQVFNTPV